MEPSDIYINIKNGHDMWDVVRALSIDDTISLLNYFCTHEYLFHATSYIQYIVKYALNNQLMFALLLAVRHNHALMTALLLENGADAFYIYDDPDPQAISMPSLKICSAINIAILNGNKIIIKLLLQNITKNKLMMYDTILYYAYSFRSINWVVDTLLYVHKKYLKYIRRHITTGYLSSMPTDIINLLILY